MKQIAIISGKGGTGKTTLSTNFLKLAKNHIGVDCDVDASNLHILFEPDILEKQVFIGGSVARVVGDCINCGKCEQLCRFDAISDSETDIKIDPVKCEGCGVCEYICPVDAIELERERQGELYISKTEYCHLIYARLDPGAENSGLLVTRIRNIAEDYAYKNSNDLIILDGAPGIGCPVISTLNGVDYALIVTEPTLSGISDLKKTIDLVEFFQIKSMVCVNKYDINDENTSAIEKVAKEKNIGLIGNIPYDEAVLKALVQKKFIVDDQKSSAAKSIRDIWKKLERILKEED